MVYILGARGCEMAAKVDASLRLLSWNIDGLDERNLRERTEEVCRLILLKRPHVVFLQEVVAASQIILSKKLGSVYSLHVSPSPPFHYFPAILTNKRCGEVTIMGELEVLDFPGSSMGRHLLQLPVTFHGVVFQLLTSHLESTRDYVSERKCQLELCFSAVREHTHQSKVCLFGGDLNVRDKEVTDSKPPECVLDVWQACGGEQEHKYTWDVSANDNMDWPYRSRPKLRFDRLYLSPKDSEVVCPVSFELVGKDRLVDCERFPSDHWGMWAEFRVQPAGPETVVID